MVLKNSRKKKDVERDSKRERGKYEKGTVRKLLAQLVCTCTPDALCLSSGMCLWEQFNHWPTQPLPQKSDPDNPLSLLHCVRVCSSLYYLASSIYFLSLPKMCLNLFFKLGSHKILLSLTTDYSMCWLKHTHTLQAQIHTHTQALMLIAF